MNARDDRAKARRALKGKWIRMAALILLANAVLLVLAGIFVFAAMGPLMVGAFQGLDRMVYGAEAATRELMQIPNSFFVVLIVGIAVILAAESLLLVGLSGAACAALRGRQPQPKQLFPIRLFGKAVAMNYLRFLLVGIQLMLLVVPGVIAALRYAMADYLLAAHPNMSPVEALRRSRTRMHGKKRELFRLMLGFIGGALVLSMPVLALRLWGRAPFIPAVIVYLLCAVGQLFLAAYALTAITVFFRRADGKNKRRGSKTATVMSEK